MSIELMSKAFKTQVGNPVRKLILLRLADQANDQGECWPSVQHIAGMCECGKATVRRHIAILESHGLLVREYRHNGTTNQSNIYRLTLDNPSQLAFEQADEAAEKVVSNREGVRSQRAGGTPTQIGGVVSQRAGGGPTASAITNHLTITNEPSVKPTREALSSSTPEKQTANGKKPADQPVPKPANVSDDMWHDFVQHRKQMKAPLTHRAAILIGNKLDGVPPTKADAMLAESIMNGWRGVFDSTTNTNTTRPAPESPKERAARMAAQRGLKHDPR